MVKFFYAAGTVTPLLDAGIVPEKMTEEFVIPHGEWLEASAEDIQSLRNLKPYVNQEYMTLERWPSDEVIIRIRYSTPCITSMGRAA